MLKQVRAGLKGFVKWIVIAPLLVAFAAWGVPELRTFTQQAPLKVGRVVFSGQQIVNEFNRETEQRRREAGGDYSREQAIADKLPDSVVSSLWTRSVLEQEAEKMGLSMPRTLVRDILHSDERFKNPITGKFDQVTLENLLQSNGLTVKQFESLMKEDLLRSQLVTALTVGAQAPAAMARGIILRDSERRRVAYLTITDALAGAAATPTAEDLKAYYEANSSKFMAPEYRTFTVASVPLKDFVKPASEEELRKAYDAAKARVYDQPEKRTLYQLTYDSESAAQAAIAALNQGKPFEAVASEKGGSLSQATLTEVGVKDMLDPTVAAAAFSPDLIAGGVAGPIKSLFGWTVVQVAAVIPPSTKSFEEVREELAQNFGQQDARKKMLEKIDQLEEARDTGSGLASAAEQAGIILSRFGPVDSNSMASGGVIIPDVPAEVLAAAFKIQEGEESEAEALAADAGYFFVQVEDVTPPAVMPFDVVANDVENRWRADERSERIAVKVKAVKDELAKGATLEQEAAKVDRAVLEAVLTRNSESDAFSAALKDELFKSAPSVVLSGPAGLGSAQTVAVVREIAFNVPQAQQQVAGYAPYLAYQLTQEQLEAYVDALREDYRVRTDQNAVAQLFSESQ